MGEKLRLPICVHTTNPPVGTAEVVKRLRSGDIYSHMYHGKGMTILDGEGSVFPEFREAKKRGVYLEVGNGKMNFHFEVAKKAVTETPARCLGIAESYGYLKVGRAADLTLLRPVAEKCCFSDSFGAEYHGDRLLVPEMTMLGGRVVYLQGGAELKKG